MAKKIPAEPIFTLLARVERELTYRNTPFQRERYIEVLRQELIAQTSRRGLLVKALQGIMTKVYSHRYSLDVATAWTARYLYHTLMTEVTPAVLDLRTEREQFFDEYYIAGFFGIPPLTRWPQATAEELKALGHAMKAEPRSLTSADVEAIEQFSDGHGFGGIHYFSIRTIYDGVTRLKLIEALHDRVPSLDSDVATYIGGSSGLEAATEAYTRTSVFADEEVAFYPLFLQNYELTRCTLESMLSHATAAASLRVLLSQASLAALTTVSKELL